MQIIQKVAGKVRTTPRLMDSGAGSSALIEPIVFALLWLSANLSSNMYMHAEVKLNTPNAAATHKAAFHVPKKINGEWIDIKSHPGAQSAS
jgi:hypothetical protein